MEKKQTTYQLNSTITWERLEEIREIEMKKEEARKAIPRIKKYV